MRGRGQLETELMGVLWEHADGLTAKQIVAAVPGKAPAITTVLTVLERLRAKGLVTKSAATAGGATFQAATSQSDHTVSRMLGSLTASGDRQAALMHFAGRLDAADAAVLRAALDGRDPVR